MSHQSCHSWPLNLKESTRHLHHILKTVWIVHIPCYFSCCLLICWYLYLFVVCLLSSLEYTLWEDKNLVHFIQYWISRDKDTVGFKYLWKQQMNQVDTCHTESLGMKTRTLFTKSVHMCLKKHYEINYFIIYLFNFHFKSFYFIFQPLGLVEMWRY